MTVLTISFLKEFVELSQQVVAEGGRKAPGLPLTKVEEM